MRRRDPRADADLPASSSECSGTARGCAPVPPREGMARACRDRPAVLRGCSPGPARMGNAQVHRYRRGSGCSSHVGTGGEGMTRAQRYRRGWGCPGAGAVGPHICPHVRSRSGRCRARSRRTQTALFLTNYPSPVPGKIYERNRGWGRGRVPAGAEAQRRAQGALCWNRRAPAAARPRRGGSWAAAAPPRAPPDPHLSTPEVAAGRDRAVEPPTPSW